MNLKCVFGLFSNEFRIFRPVISNCCVIFVRIMYNKD